MTVSGNDEGYENPQTNAQTESNVENTTPPSFMYVHYLTEAHQDRYPVYLFQVDPDQMDNEIKAAIDAIVGNKAPEVKPGPLGKVEWKVYSYAVFVLNSTRSKIDRVDFHHEGTGHNHTFGGIGDLPRYKNCTAVYYLNKRKNKNNHSLGPNEKDIVKWEAFHTPPIHSAAKGIVNHQNSDPNTGP